ncbi:MAG: hypothetical protein CM15mP75_6530 [Flammeovirgaceae bacterium]|nr:MAG: hypothetical protein CM15mP75_6530 [Flammeovirgaceae bacterium]
MYFGDFDDNNSIEQIITFKKMERSSQFLIKMSCQNNLIIYLKICFL